VDIQQHALTVIVGMTGSGKSTLLSGILGECLRIKGDVAITGTISYVPQSPWIQSGTIRENILFGAPFDQER
jgi:ABC-type transport system involved in cytochrome bd biosynthesis fused ATPase/permease subunit